VKYVGGTLAGCKLNTAARIYLIGPDSLLFRCPTAEVRVEYSRLTALRYSQTLRRRWAESAASAAFWPIVPLVLANPAHRHFVTVEYTDAAGTRQGLIMLVPKDNIHRLLDDLKVRAGRPVEFEDKDPRK
jgi:hypothetical protein